jgi:hypothetical protein
MSKETGSVSPRLKFKGFIKREIVDGIKYGAKAHPLRAIIVISLAVSGCTYEVIKGVQAIKDPVPPAQFQSNAEQYSNSPLQIDSKNAEDYKEEIEKQFDISIVGTEENPSIIQSEFGADARPASWNETKLKILQETLENLPGYFYKPYLAKIEDDVSVTGQKEIEQDLKIQLVTGPTTSGNNSAEGLFDAGNLYSETSDKDAEADRIFISTQAFGQNFITGVLTHELTHRAFDKNYDTYTQDIYNILNVKTDTDFNNLMNKQNDLTAVIKSLPRAIWEDRSITGGVVRESYDYNCLEYEKLNANELTAVMSQFYVQGEGNFTATYAPAFGKIKTQELYNFMKNEVFMGKEYPSTSAVAQKYK